MMNNRIKNGIALAIIPQIFLVKWLGGHPELIETYYSNGLYPVVSRFFRILFGWIPFSIGDVVYALLVFLALRYLIVRWREIRNRPRSFGRDLVMVLSIAYFTFHLLWGLNYYRQPLRTPLNLQENHSRKELVQLVEQLIQKTNEIQFAITSDTAQMVKIPYSKREIRQRTVKGYQKLGKRYPFLAYGSVSLKNSLFSLPLTYMGYGGYLNPFTHEAQVNAKLPDFRFPVVCGHEVGHQLGYSAENETNFIGYLVTMNNEDPYFQYAAYAYALGYCLSDIKRKDKAGFEQLYKQLNTGIKKNFQEVNDFWEAYKNPLEPVFKSAFNSFLKANNQQDGIKSYSKVVSLLVAYHAEHSL